jgi:hypothetical protein
MDVGDMPGDFFECDKCDVVWTWSTEINAWYVPGKNHPAKK